MSSRRSRCDRAQLGHGASRRAQYPLAAQQRAQPLHPAAPGELRDGDGDEGDDRAHDDEEVEQIAAGLLAAALDEAHVVNQHESPARAGGGLDVADRNVQQPVCGPQHPLGGDRRDHERGAADLGRKGEGRDRVGAPGQAQAHRIQALVLDEAIEECRHPTRGIRTDQRGKGFLDRRCDQAGAHVEVAYEPALHQRIGQRHCGPCESGERQQ